MQLINELDLLKLKQQSQGNTETFEYLIHNFLANYERQSIFNYDNEPVDILDRVRESGTAVGLKNIGNSCYFNCLMQLYFNLPSFVEKIFEEN